MPNVGGVQYPYTPQGVAAAQQAQAGLDPARMSPPLTSPSHPMAQRQTPDLQPAKENYNAMNFYGWRGQAGNPLSPRTKAPTYEDRYTMQSDPNIWTSGATMRGQQRYGNSPSNPSYQPIAQAPRGRTIETTDPGVGYGNSPSNPNWGQERGGSVGRMGPMNAPVSANYSAISPSNRIAGNIAAVKQGRQGPSPGTSPYLNQSGRLESPPNARPWTGFGPTGQPVPSRQAVQKGIPRG